MCVFVFVLILVCVYVFVLWLSIQDTRGHTPIHAVHVRKYVYAHVRKREEERRG